MRLALHTCVFIISSVESRLDIVASEVRLSPLCTKDDYDSIKSSIELIKQAVGKLHDLYDSMGDRGIK